MRPNFLHGWQSFARHGTQRSLPSIKRSWRELLSHREIIGRSPLRFIRSGSARLPPQVLAELERVFNAPVIEFYGMTEAPL